MPRLFLTLRISVSSTALFCTSSLAGYPVFIDSDANKAHEKFQFTVYVTSFFEYDKYLLRPLHDIHIFKKNCLFSWISFLTSWACHILYRPHHHTRRCLHHYEHRGFRPRPCFQRHSTTPFRVQTALLRAFRNSLLRPYPELSGILACTWDIPTLPALHFS